MRYSLSLALAVHIIFLGCERNSERVLDEPAKVGVMTLSPEMASFSEEWRAATIQDRQAIADVSRICRIFIGVPREQVKAVFGEADQSGIDNIGMDVLKYELGVIPDMEDAEAYLTFVFENNKVTSVMGNTISF